MVATATDDPGRFLNRELSWLAFDERVLALAADASLPWLERVRVLGIFACKGKKNENIRVEMKAKCKE